MDDEAEKIRVDGARESIAWELEAFEGFVYETLISVHQGPRLKRRVEPTDPWNCNAENENIQTVYIEYGRRLRREEGKN
jgi:hypothetical protein